MFAEKFGTVWGGVFPVAAADAVFWGAAALSFLAGAAAVALPQAALLSSVLVRKMRGRDAFSWWAGKFSLTILLLAGAARLLHESAQFAAGWFAAGAILAAAFNVAVLAARA
ncbi:MAG: hypothetical protein ACR2P5_08620 [Gammaproteobacteria bacterium]